jgi:predicted amidophosphoribosyltransferase
MEIMDGNVTLDCGHEMCPTCFAQHSRENHTCPYCRKPFAPKINKKEKMPIQVAEEMISLNVKNYYFDEMHDELNVIIDKLTSKETLDARYVEDVKASIYAHLSEMSLVMWEDIEQWYDDN